MNVSDDRFKGKIGIIGAGALGGYYGAQLAESGCDVHFLMRSDYDVVRERGLIVHSIQGDFTLQPKIYRSASELGSCDLVIIGLKATDNHALPALLAATTTPQTIILTLQNGLGNEEFIAQAIREIHGISSEQALGNVIGGTAFLCSNRIGPGEISHTDHGWIRIAEAAGTARPRTHQLAMTFEQAKVHCEVNNSLALTRWAKLVWNIPFNGLGAAALQANTADVMGDEHLLATARGLMEEVLAAAEADGVTLDPALVHRNIENTRTMGPYKSSMQIDAELGNPMEVEAIIGEALRRGLAGGAALPRMQMLYAILSRMNQGR